MRILIAGVGNVFLSDDGFGVAVARKLSAMDLPDGVSVTDFGIRGIHLAYELTEGYDITILIDALPRGERPGTLFVLEPSQNWEAPAFIDAHDLTPDAVLALAGVLSREFGGRTIAGEVLLVGCQPEDVSPGMELSPPVAAAVDAATGLVLDLVEERLRRAGVGAPHAEGR
ncbi:hydrogenase maturation protease [Sinosporangium album]|uniref:Hydrogenase maturation protease n=1 Tax=Sinosporangium album TaxID=504805 RepID=A0A1G8HHS5_9ACTN|nr:hydrogenase maturation protease [Sinosporangium album]SDI06257.1 hydrogenase maturation protease [Sinosporangium album]